MTREHAPSERQGRIEQICQAALDHDAGDRAAFLAEVCAGDVDLQREVESLLAHEQSAAGFIESPALHVAAKVLPERGLVGARIGPYEMIAILGAGGMGDVYRAHDSQLGRDVAIKVLPPAFLNDADRLARFDREARVLASLNHPHISAIYGLEHDAGGRQALVLELVEGPTLAEQLKSARARTHVGLPVAEALSIASQIATALETAHAKGIVHRDLKPANVKITGNGQVKVLDFGLAKIAVPTRAAERWLEAESAVSLSDASPGLVVGTAAYMSPEQARGDAVDDRTDIWAFGCVLFEMLAGRPAFHGETTAQTLGRVLERDPDWGSLPADTPRAIRTLLERCLRKDPAKRLHDIADARIEIDECDLTPAPVQEPAQRTRPVWWLAAALLVVASVSALVFSKIGGLPLPSELFEFPVVPSDQATLLPRYGGFAVSPDGRQIVVTAKSGNRSSLWVRPIGSLQYRELPGTHDALFPFWKPDGLAIGFFAEGLLKIVALRGGLPTVVCEAPDLPEGSERDEVGGSWNRDDVIIFMSSAFTLNSVLARAGAAPAALTVLAKGETAHRWPSFLPDGQRFLYLALTRPGDPGELRIGYLDGTPPISLGRHESNARYSAGHLLFLSGRHLVAQRFDADAGRLTGTPLPVVTKPPFATWNLLAAFSVSESGVLATHPGGPIPSEQRLTWRDRSGKTVGVFGEPGRYPTLDLSPDGKRVAASLVRGTAASDIWILDLERGDAVPLTTDPAWEFDPTWSRDGKQLVFNSNRSDGRVDLFLRAADGSGQDERVVAARHAAETPSWVPGDRSIVYGDDGDNWIHTLDGKSPPSVLWKTPARERAGTLSPDGRWLAYSSDKSGRSEVYVREFPSGAAEHKVSVDGGMAARWRGDGKEIFFLSLDATMMAARVETVRGFRMLVPEPLFPSGLSLVTLRPYAVTADGQRFLIPTAIDQRSQPPIMITMDWRARLPR
ncbi:Serine/threonine-protein kinase PrkC [Luteitalea pratensis]|uniref:Serine/threonine-protein kinase PrkC n=1 Tax=Luteitalea pratensis TaxID=1855912 RepID=A0A143PGY0_LUTPR|nr:protein kinase [Luteitalea pratensis]AMY07817.1 Serine/threonine-protein kinase PrkC [Luteitalea pratensis]